METDCLFDGRKYLDPEPMSEEEATRFDLFAEKEVTSFGPLTENIGSQ